VVSYNCVNCFKIFIKKIDYERHINRKFRCKPIKNNENIINNLNNEVNSNMLNIPPYLHQNSTNLHQNSTNLHQNSTEMHRNLANDESVIEMTHICKYCRKIFVRNSVLKRHIDENRCKVKKMIDEQNNKKEDMVDLLMAEIERNKQREIEKDKQYQEREIEKDKQYQEREIEHQKQINDLTKSLQKMESKINKTTNKIMNNNNGTINNTVNNTYVMKFGSENSLEEHLNKKELEYILSKHLCVIQASVQTLHFNKRLPHLLNVYLSAKNAKDGLIFDGKKYILDPLDNILDDLYNDHKGFVENLIESRDDLKLVYKQEFIDYILNVFEILENNDNPNKNKKINKIKADIKLILYNERELAEKKQIELKKLLVLKESNKKLALLEEDKMMTKDSNGIITL